MPARWHTCCSLLLQCFPWPKVEFYVNRKTLICIGVILRFVRFRGAKMYEAKNLGCYQKILRYVLILPFILYA